MLLWSCASLASELALEVLPSGLTSLEVRAGDHTMPMLLDLGASRTVLTRESQVLLGLPEPWRTVEAEAVGGSIPAALYRDLAFEVGEHSFIPSIVAVIDLAPLREKIGGEFGGILGADFFATADVLLDIPSGKAQVLPKGSFRPEPDWTEVALFRRRGDLWVRVQVDGQTFPALVDTGADATGLDPGVVSELGLEQQATDGLAVQGADGRPVALSMTAIKTLSIGAACMEAGPIQATAEQTTGRLRSVHLGTDRLFAQPIALSVARQKLFVAPHVCGS